MTTPTAVVFDLDGPPDPDDECSYLAAGFRRLAARHGLRRVPADELAEGLLATGDRSADRVAAVVCSAGTVTRPRCPELTSDDAVGVHREWLAEWL